MWNMETVFQIDYLGNIKAIKNWALINITVNNSYEWIQGWYFKK